MSETKKVSYNTKLGKVKFRFNNKVDFCVGTGRAGLALQKEYFEQLKYVQDIIGFKHIRGHGLFTDDMAIYHEYENENGEVKSEYNLKGQIKEVSNIVCEYIITSSISASSSIRFSPVADETS